MNVTPITIDIGGVERTLRCSHGARRRIQKVIGGDFKAALQAKGADALIDVLHALLHDATGKPPADIPDTDSLAELLPSGSDADTELMAAIMSAMVQGKTSKNEIEELLKAAKAATEKKPDGSVSGDSVPRSSESVQ